MQNNGSFGAWLLALFPIFSAYGFCPLQPQWQTSFGTFRGEAVMDIREAADGGYDFLGFPFTLGYLDANGSPVTNRFRTLQMIARTFASLPDGGKIVVGDRRTFPDENWLQYVIVTRLDSQGTVVWEQRFETGDVYGETFPTSVAIAQDGSIVVGANTSSGVTRDKAGGTHGGADFWVMRLTESGKIWDASFGGTNDDLLLGLRILPNGEIIAAGQSASGSDGNKSSPNQGLYDLWLVGMDMNGNKTWEASFGGAEQDMFAGLDLLPDGGFILTGSTASPGNGPIKWSSLYGESDYWVLRLNPLRQIIWEKSFGGDRADVAEASTLLADGSLIVAGWSRSEPQTGTRTSPQRADDGWVIRTDLDGNQLWDHSVTNWSLTRFRSASPTSDGGAILGGSIRTPGEDYYMLKLKLDDGCDADQDGIPDLRDQCEATPLGSVVNGGGCSIAQLAPCAGPWRNHAHYVHTVAMHVTQFHAQNLITRAEARRILRQAIKSDCGQRRSIR